MTLPKRDGGWSGGKLLPLFLLTERGDTVVVVGVSPLAVTDVSLIDANQLETLRRLSNFRLFYTLAAKEMKISIKKNCGMLHLFHANGNVSMLTCFLVDFNPNACEIARNDAQEFLGYLDYLFKKVTSAGVV